MTASTPIVSGFCNPSQAYCNYTSTGAARADMIYSQASDIVIHTLEGDTVTLSSSTYNTGGYETYEALAAGKGTFAYRYGETAYFESRQQMSIAVTGDLSQEELEDIESILDTLDDMMKDLMSGNLESALSRSSRFTGIDTISSFSADLNITATFITSRFETASASTYVPGIPDEESDTEARIDRMADRISTALNTRTALVENLMQKIDDSFSDWFDRASLESNDQSQGMKWAQRFTRRLMDGLKPGVIHEGEQKNHPVSEQNNTLA